MKRLIKAYYADERKYIFRTKNPLSELETDKKGDQLVHVSGSVSGITIRPDKRWTPFCDKLFRETKADGVWLENIGCAPEGKLDFLNDLQECKRLVIEDGKEINLGPLKKNPSLEDLQLGPAVRPLKFDLASLPSLRRCQIPLSSELGGFLSCRQLICLSLGGGGSRSEMLDLNSLAALEEFICVGVKKLTAVTFNPSIRLRSLKLSHMKEFSSIGPLDVVTGDLRIVELNRVPKIKLEWLADARMLECISLRLGGIPTVGFIRGLKHLRVLDLFGSKVLDGDWSLVSSLSGELGVDLWGSKK